jgi:rod shape-determining protein MreD
MNSTLLSIFSVYLVISRTNRYFNNMNLGFIIPLPYILFIILYPVNGNRSGLILASFALGLMMDIFLNSGGTHATACLVLAYVRPSIFKFSFGISYEYQTIKLNDVLTLSVFLLYALCCNSSSYTFPSRSISNQFLLGYLNTRLC